MSVLAVLERAGQQLREIHSRPELPFRGAHRTVDLGAADIIVSVGRGIKEKENIPMVKELADVLCAELGASPYMRWWMPKRFP